MGRRRRARALADARRPAPGGFSCQIRRAAKHRLKPRDAAGRPRLELHRDGGLRHGYVVNPSPRRIEEFADVIADSFSDRATFMHAVLVARFWPTRSVTLRNLTLIEAEGTSYRVRQIPGREHLPDVIEEHFQIPRPITREALDGVELTTQPWVPGRR